MQSGPSEVSEPVYEIGTEIFRLLFRFLYSAKNLIYTVYMILRISQTE